MIFDQAMLEGARFDDAIVVSAFFRNAHLAHAKFRDSDLTKADFSYGRDFPKRNNTCYYADFSRATLTNATLSRCPLTLKGRVG